MPCSYQIDGERGLVITTAWDTLTVAEVVEHQSQLGSDVGFNSAFSQLLDFTRVTRVAVDFTAMNELAERHLFSVKSRRAFLVGRNPLAYGMSRMFIACRRLTGDEQMRVFIKRDEAVQWLSCSLAGSASGAL